MRCVHSFLLFAFRLIPALPAFDCLARQSCLQLLPASLDAFVSDASMRSVEELQFARSAAEFWLLRCNISQIVEEKIVYFIKAPFMFTFYSDNLYAFFKN